MIGLQIAMGAFDTLYHHELTERLAWRPSQERELRLHGVRNLLTWAFRPPRAGERGSITPEARAEGEGIAEGKKRREPQPWDGSSELV